MAVWKNIFLTKLFSSEKVPYSTTAPLPLALLRSVVLILWRITILPQLLQLLDSSSTAPRQLLDISSTSPRQLLDSSLTAPRQLLDSSSTAPRQLLDRPECTSACLCYNSRNHSNCYDRYCNCSSYLITMNTTANKDDDSSHTNDSNIQKIIVIILPEIIKMVNSKLFGFALEPRNAWNYFYWRYPFEFRTRGKKMQTRSLELRTTISWNYWPQP